MQKNQFELIPRFKPSLLIHIARDDLLLVLSENKRVALHHPFLAKLASAIDGERTVGQMIDLLQAQLSAVEVTWGLRHLEAQGYLGYPGYPRYPDYQDAPDDVRAAAEQAWWELFASSKPLQAPRLSVQALAGIDGALLEQSLSLAGLTVLPLEDSQLHILLLDDAQRPEVIEIGARCAALNKPLLLIKANGMQPSVGPLLHPQMGSCPHCLQFWLRQQQPLQSWVKRQQPSNGHFLPLALQNGAAQAIYGLAAQAVMNLFASGRDTIPLRNHILTLDLKTFQTSRHRLVKRPQCPACGDPDLLALQASSAPILRTVQARACQDGGYRQQDPQTTIAQYQHLVSPVCGPVSYLHPMPGRHQGIRKVYVAGYLACPEDAPYSNNFDKICAGKGHTDAQAQASALCETLERWSGVWQGDEPTLRSSRAALLARGEQACEFNDLQNFSARQFAARAEINAANADPRRQVPLPHPGDAVIDWVPAWSMRDGARHYLPLTYCYAQAPGSSGRAYGIHNPNGCAAGVGREEAVLQALLELIERDACAIWWYNRLPRPALRLDQIDDAFARRLHGHYQELGWEAWAVDLTHDLAIPVYAALAYEPQRRRYAIGFGCHLDAPLALQRALTELNQLFDPAQDAVTPWDQALLPDAGFLHPRHGYADLPASRADIGGSDLLADIQHCVQTLEQAGLHCLMLEKTRPEIGLSVMQVVVPGLRHFWPRLGLGRLYDVPVRMGWLARATEETELNPAPLFL